MRVPMKDGAPRLLALILAVLAACSGETAREPQAGPPAVTNAAPFSDQPWAELLGRYVDERGAVDYQALQLRRQPLEAFCASLGHLERSTFASWPERDQIALLINAYNAFTMKAVLDHYPIQAGFLGSLRFPRNSIRQISGVWDKLQFSLLGSRVTLDQIEHKMLRVNYSEPRIHMALVCASRGCPPLRNEPYRGPQLEAQLDDQARRFLGDPSKFRIDRTAGRLELSKIFQWYGKDFESRYGEGDGFAGRSASERAVLRFISRYLRDRDRSYLERGRYTLHYLDYDWSLNEQAK